MNDRYRTVMPCKACGAWEFYEYLLHGVCFGCRNKEGAVR